MSLPACWPAPCDLGFIKPESCKSIHQFLKTHTHSLVPVCVCVCVYTNACMRAQLLQLSLTLCYPMDYSPRSSSVRGILQARIVGWVACPPPGDPPNTVTKSTSPKLKGHFLPIEPHGKSIYIYETYPIGSVSLTNPKRVCILSLTVL